MGFAIQLYCYREAVVHVWILTGVAYAIMLTLPRKTQAKYVMVWVLAHLSLSHVHRMWMNFGGFDLEISTYNMLQVCKLSAMAFCYQDGGRDDLTERQKKLAIKKLPNLFELASYTYYTQACALGVFFEFTNYFDFIKCEGEYRDRVSPILPSLKSLGEALLFTGIFFAASMHFPIETCYTSAYAAWSFPYKYFYYMVAMTGKRFFYYGPFMFTTGAI